MKFPFFKNKAKLPRNGRSVIEIHGSEYLSLSQPERADVLRNVARDYGSKLLPGFDFESILVVRKNIPPSESELIERALEKSEADFTIRFLENKNYPLLIFTLSVLRIDVSVLPLHFAIDITDPDFQDFVQHLPGSFEMAVFWFNEENDRLFYTTSGIAGDNFVKSVASAFQKATAAYWKIPENLRDFETAVNEASESL